MLELNIDPELKAWIDPLSPDEYAQLEANILAEGCRDPLVVWGSYLLDGHNRYEICHKHGIEFSTYEKSGLVTKDDVKIWMIQNQMGKRNLSDFARTAMALKLKPLLEQRARARQITSTGGQAPQLRQNSAEAGKRANEEIAATAGVSRETVRIVEKIIGQAAPEVIEKVRAGTISINAAARTIGAGKPTKSDAANAVPTAKSKSTPPAALAAPAKVPESSEVEGCSGASENEELREQIAELSESLRTTLADNESMGRIFDADDRIKAAMAEVARWRAIAENAERTLDSKNEEYVARARMVTHWKNRAEKAEKALAKLKEKYEPER